jgi:uncharacterized protein YeaO (DUF488 family)
MTPDIEVKRVYEPAISEDGVRILVDRIWPRGMTKATAALTHWFKDIAPTTTLRKWFGHDPARWEEFCRRYRAELDENPAMVLRLCDLMKTGRVTFLYGAHDTPHNQALALAAYMRDPKRAGKRVL